MVGQGLDVARQRIVAFIAVHVHAQAALGGQLAQQRTDSAPSCMVRSKCGMPPTTSTPMSSARLRLSIAPGRAARRPAGRRPAAIQVGLDLLAHVQQRLHRQQARIAHVHVRTDRQQAAPRPSRNRPARSTSASCVSSGLSSPHSAMPSSSVPDWFTRGSPKDSVESMWKCASTKAATPAGRPRRCARGLGLERRLQRRDAALGDADVDVLAAVGQRAAFDDQVEHGGSSRKMSVVHGAAFTVVA